MKVVFITPAAPGISPGQRFRFEHYLGFLNEHNIQYSIKPFFTAHEWKLMYNKGNTVKKMLVLLAGFFKRLALLFSLSSYDKVYVYREALPFGPPLIEWIIAKVLRKKIVYDFDDAIWISTASTANPFAAKIKCTWKVGKICKWSNIVTTGNEFLAQYARQFCKDVRVIPTVVDTTTSHNLVKNQDEQPLAIGWTGTFTNFIHLPLAINAIKNLQKEFDFEFIIIADQDPLLDNVKYTYLPWNKDTEVSDLLKMNIGIMPLQHTDIQLGKCAFKAIQYMSLGIPAVVSPVGANCEVVTNGINGYWADNDDEWYNRLKELIEKVSLRYQMGKVAKNDIENKYSVNATRKIFIHLFQ